MKLDSRRARTPADLLAFAHGAEAHDFEPASRAEACGHIRDALRRFPYGRLSRARARHAVRLPAASPPASHGRGCRG